MDRSSSTLIMLLICCNLNVRIAFGGTYTWNALGEKSVSFDSGRMGIVKNMYLYLNAGSRLTPCRDDNNSTTSIMIARLEKINALVADGIDNSMFACQTARPGIAIKVFEWFWFANPSERISQNRFHKRHNAKGYLAIRLNPIVQVCTKFWMENSIAHYYFSPTSRRKSSMDWAGSVPAFARFSAVASRSAFLGELRI